MLIDIAYLICFLWAVYKGFRKGFIVSLFSFLAFFIGISFALKLMPIFTVFIEDFFSFSSKYLPFFSFLILFIAILLLVRLISLVITKLLEFVFLSLPNKIAGAFLMVGIVTFIFSIFLWISNQANLISPELKVEANTYRYVEPVAPTTLNLLSDIVPGMGRTVDVTEELFERLTTKSSPFEE